MAGIDVYEYKQAAVYARIADHFGDKVTVETDSPDGSVMVAADDLADVCTWCRDDEGVAAEMLGLISGVDYPKDDKIQVVYHLESISRNHMVVLKVDLPREDPILPSVVDVWPVADWLERETYDLLGVIFEGHPNLRRILCSEDWEGHPLRKDYVLPAYYHGIPNIYFEKQLTEEQKKLIYGDLPEETRTALEGK